MPGSAMTGSRRSLLAAAVALLLVGVIALVWAVHRPSGDTPPQAGADATSSVAPAPITVASSAPPVSTPASPVTSPSATPASPVTNPSTTSAASRPAGSPKPSSTAVKPTPQSSLTSLSASMPKQLKIPELGIDTSLITLGLNADQSVEVPPSPNEVGWYQGSPTPGQLGPSVILGHVSWLGTPAAFYKVGTLKRGQTLSISRADGKVLTFTVQGVREYPKNKFPTSQIYGNLDYAGLRLITCSGDYDANRHYFPDNLVVYAQLTSVHQA